MLQSALAEIWVSHRDGNEFGTAFAIGRNRIATSGHLFTHGHTSIHVRFLQEPTFKPTVVNLLWKEFVDGGPDMAIIECELPSCVTPLTLALSSVETAAQSWETLGFPRIGRSLEAGELINNPVPFQGTLTSVSVTQKQHQLTVTSFTTDKNSAKGLSGSPVVMSQSHQVIGVISKIIDGFDPVRVDMTTIWPLLLDERFIRALGTDSLRRQQIAERAFKDCKGALDCCGNVSFDNQLRRRLIDILRLSGDPSSESVKSVLPTKLSQYTTDGLTVFTQLMSCAVDFEKQSEWKIAEMLIQLAEAMLPLHFPEHLYQQAVDNLRQRNAIMANLVTGEVGAQIVMATIDERKPRFERDHSSGVIWGEGSLRGSAGPLGQPGPVPQAAQIVLDLIQAALPGFYSSTPDVQEIERNIKKYAADLNASIIANKEERNVSQYCLVQAPDDGNNVREEVLLDVAKLIPSLRFICVKDTTSASEIEARIFTVLRRNLPRRPRR